jgi:WD40 repeat protein
MHAVNEEVGDEQSSMNKSQMSGAENSMMIEEDVEGDLKIRQDLDKPISIRPRVSASHEDTMKEIGSSYVAPSRPLIKFQFIKKRREFAQVCKLNEKDASEGLIEFRSIVSDPSFSTHVKKRTIDMGLQGHNPTQESSTQTNWNRKINRIIQTASGDLLKIVDEESSEFLGFIQNAYAMMEEALQSNEIVNIFEDDFAVIPYEDAPQTDAKLTNDISELKAIMAIKYTAGKRISCLQIQPPIPGNKTRFVAASYMGNYNFDEKIELWGRALKASILLWDVEDASALKPILELQSPLEITNFEFNPKDPFMIIGGASNGQIVMWEFGSTLKQILADKKSNKTKQERPDDVPGVKHVLISSLQDPNTMMPPTPNLVSRMVPSHKSSVVCLKWTPNNYDMDTKRQLWNINPNTTGDYTQFVSLSEDGQVLLWDIKFQEKDPRKNPEVGWKAFFAIQMVRPEGGGPMGGSQVCFLKNQKNGSLLGASDEGEMFVFDWGQKPGEENTKIEYINRIWNSERSYRPCIALEKSSFFEDIVMTVHDFHFCLWKLDTDIPIFSSPILAGGQLTCGTFSPTRPGVILVGRSDGILEVWDLTDQSHKCIIPYQVGSFGVSYIKFQEGTSNMVNVGDMEGALHVLMLPQNLSKKVGNEENTMNEFFLREVRRVDYFRKRFDIRDELHKKKQEDKEREEQHKESKEFTKKEDADHHKRTEEDAMEDEYEAFVTRYMDEFIEKKEKPPVDPKAVPAKK